MKNAASKKAEKEVRALERQIRRQKEKLAKLRHRVAPKPIADHVLSVGGKATRLSSLFGRKSELILIHNMGVSCPYCTLWADGFNGMRAHLEDRAAFAVESPDRPATQRKFAAKRGWKFRMASSHGTTFRKEAGFESKEGDPRPGVSTFIKDGKGRIFQTASTEFGPGDNYCSLWDLLDLLPKGVGRWEAKFSYR